MTFRVLNRALRCGTVAAALLAPTLPSAAPLPASDASPLVKRLPANRDMLTLRGESAGMSWPVYLGRDEAAAITTLQLGLLNTVSALPERSQLRVAINGRPVAVVPIRSPERTTTLSIRVPPGTLVPGFNAVTIDSTMTHRVDCSVAATYELWAALDPATTGFLLPGGAMPAGRTSVDLAGETLAADGTTRIHVRLADPDPTALGHAAALVSALAARAHLVRPVVDVGPAAGTGPGIDLAFEAAALAGTSEIGHEGGLRFLRDAGSNRLTVLAEATDAAAFEAVVTALRQEGRPPAGAAAGLQAIALQGPMPVEADQRVSFADLGFHGVAFAGRHFTRTLGMRLPDDFYPGNYDTVRLYVDGGHAADLLPGSALVVRVNGALVSTVSLGPETPTRLDHALVNLPLRFFRPGSNAVELEATTEVAADRQCTVDPGRQPAGRFDLADTSELVMPHLARLRTEGRIGTALAGGGTRDIFVTSADRSTLGAALTLAANMAPASPQRVRFTLDAPSPSDPSGLVIGPIGNLPGWLAGPLRSRFTPAAASPQGDVSAATAAPATVPETRPTDLVHAMLGGTEHWLRRNGFFYADLAGRQDPLPVREAGLLVADLRPHDGGSEPGGFDLPRFTARPDHWLVVTAATPDALMAAEGALLSNDRWKDLAGASATYDPTRNDLQQREPDRLGYVMPDTVEPGDLRPILGGLVSGNILVSVAVLLVLLALLGATTHRLLAIFGEGNR